MNICLSAKTLSADGVESESLLEFSASGCLLRVSLEAVGREAVTGTVVVGLFSSLKSREISY